MHPRDRGEWSHVTTGGSTSSQRLCIARTKIFLSKGIPKLIRPKNGYVGNDQTGKPHNQRAGNSARLRSSKGLKQADQQKRQISQVRRQPSSDLTGRPDRQ